MIFVIGIVTGLFDALIGAGGLVSIPALIFLGLPPQVAIATDRLGLLGALFPALYKYWKAKKIVWKYVPVFSAIALISSIIGANILLNTDPGILEPLVGIIVLVLLPLIFLKRDVGIKSIKTTRSRTAIGLILFLTSSENPQNRMTMPCIVCLPDAGCMANLWFTCRCQ